MNLYTLVIINYRIKHVDMNKKSILWSALKQKAEDLQIFLESNNVKNPISEILEGNKIKCGLYEKLLSP